MRKEGIIFPIPTQILSFAVEFSRVIPLYSSTCDAVLNHDGYIKWYHKEVSQPQASLLASNHVCIIRREICFCGTCEIHVAIYENIFCIAQAQNTFE